ncbi:MAG: DUF4097 family beta strand repeat-containing protein [Planctomycetes bacterium]|nr:DUF4097 family beta strand repeat-containing protein [Planctomycetota bacterium]
MRTGALVKMSVATGLVALLLGGCVIYTGGYKAEFSRSEDLTVPATDITALDVTTNVGKIQLETAEAAEVRIAAAIKVKARTEEKAQELAEQVRLVAEPAGQTLTIKAIKPPDLGRNQWSVDFTIKAPAALALRCTTNVGDIRIDGFTKRVQASADVGTIVCSGLRDEVDLHANVGDLRATYASDAPAALNARMETNVGSLEFTGPPEISADLTAKANVGEINTSRPLTVRGSLNRHSVRASLGNGEGRVNLDTNVGSIRIR